MVDLVPRKNPLLFNKPKADPVVNPKNINSPWSVAGSAPTAAEIRKFMRLETAREALGVIYPGCSIFGITKGQFSLVELIKAIIEQTGPAHMFISTWTTSGKHLDEAHEFIEGGAWLSCRFLLDHTFQRRKPAFAARLRELFGIDSVRVTRNHAKFVLIRNDNWNLVLKTSMNLNFNPRLEHFDILDDVAQADFLEDLMDDIFNKRKETDINDPSHLNEKRFLKL